MRFFLSKEKRDSWARDYCSKHEYVGVVCGDFLPILPIYTALILGKINLDDKNCAECKHCRVRTYSK